MKYYVTRCQNCGTDRSVGIDTFGEVVISRRCRCQKADAFIETIACILLVIWLCWMIGLKA